MGNDLISARQELTHHNDALHDMAFILDKQEQYSRKSSVRILGVKEGKDECVEDVFIACVKEQIGVSVDKHDIDIVHRVGRFEEGKPRPILIKFLSHKTKEVVMRKKKEAKDRAKDVKIVEDLANGIRKIYTFLNANRRDLKLEYVWTIDGRIKYKFFGNNRPFEIRSYADYYRLINNTK